MLVDIGDIFWLQIAYEDTPSEFKIRPVIIIDKKENTLFILVSTTSQPPDNPPSYFDQFKIPIFNWRKFGLLKPSWGLGYRLIKLTENELTNIVKKTDYIGHMDEKDLQYLIREIELKHNNDF